MGFRFRKSVNLGGVRINFSKSGVGYSYGGKGVRITKKANGGTRTTLSIPGAGISYVEESGGSATQRKNNVVPPPTPNYSYSKPQGTPTSGLVCPICGEPVPQSDYPFCMNCGADVSAEFDLICYFCKTPARQGQRFCTKCGALLPSRLSRFKDALLRGDYGCGGCGCGCLFVFFVFVFLFWLMGQIG